MKSYIQCAGTILSAKANKTAKTTRSLHLLGAADHKQTNMKTSLQQCEVLWKTVVAEDRVVLEKCKFRKGLGEGLLRKATFQHSPEGGRE